MKVQIYDEAFPYMIIDDYYDEEEVDMIWEELEFLSYSHKLKRATEDRGGAIVDGKLVKHNYHRFIDDIYEERELSNILTVNRKLLADEGKIIKQHPHWFFQNSDLNNKDFTQISYYEENDEYGEHRDLSIITALSWFYKEPKKFTGGDLFLGPDKIKIDCVNNRTVIIPSMITHSVNTIQISQEYRNKRQGRYAISQFLKAV